MKRCHAVTRPSLRWVLFLLSLFLMPEFGTPSTVSGQTENPTSDGALQETDRTVLLQEYVRQSYRDRDQGNYRAAVQSGTKAVALAPDNTSLLIHLGSCQYMLGEMKEAVQSFDRAIERDERLSPQLWQRGLALYYLKRYEDGKKQFETHQTYNTQDVENAVWRMLCHRHVDDLEAARKDLIPITADRRIPMSQIHELYAGQCSEQDVLEAAQSINGSPAARNEALYYAHLYVGLYQEMTGQKEASLESMRQAEKVNPIGKSYLMGSVARVHLQLRKQEAEKSREDSDSQPEGDGGK